MGEIYSGIIFGPQEPEQKYMIVVNGNGEEEEILEDQFWEYSPDAMHCITTAPNFEEGEQ